MLLVLAALQGAVPQLPDTTVYADSATLALVERAMDRHRNSDVEVQDYTARIRYRLSFGFGRRRWAEVPNAAVEEQEGRVRWAAPNDLRLEILGRRARSRSENMNISSVFDRPWFVPRSLGDSVRIFGNEFPERAALHPLAADGPAWYHYALIDSISVLTPNGHNVKLLAVDVLPRRKGGALIAGRLWLDAESADVVRFGFRYVGTDLWVLPDGDTKGDSGDARRANKLINRVLSLDADLEYSLQDEKHWMPYRQVISGRVELPWFGELVIPFQASTTFDEYEINTGQPIAFTVELPDSITDPDSLQKYMRERRDSLRAEGRRRNREGGKLKEDDLPRDDAGRWTDGRFEIHRAPGDSLVAYGGWGDSLEFNNDPAATRQQRELAAELERMTVDLPPDLTGRPTSGFGWERLSDIVRYNRVQGFATGLAYQVQLPNDRFTSLLGEIRYGFSDERLTGALTVTREAPGARWKLRGYREMSSVEPFSRAHNLGNSLSGIFAAHDDADYMLAQGGSISREASLGLGLELTTTARVEVEESVDREAKSGVNDFLGGSGIFPENPAVKDGTFGGLSGVLEGFGFRTRWRLGADLLGGAGEVSGRFYGVVRQTLGGGARNPSLALKGGIATSTDLPQHQFRLGGVPTVHGFDYGTRVGQAFWAAQINLPLTKGLIRPVLFADAGQAGKPDDIFSSSVMAGAGAGLSFFGGVFRVDLSHGITDGGDDVRLDIRTGLGW